jgi:hypothetical protein
MPLEIRDPSPSPIQTSQSIAVVAVDPIENAIAEWAEASTRAETRDREDRLKDKEHIIRSFLKYVGKHPGEVDPADVRKWRKHLESQKAKNTVYSYISRVSSFYEWLRKYPRIKETHGNEVNGTGHLVFTFRRLSSHLAIYRKRAGRISRS